MRVLIRTLITIALTFYTLVECHAQFEEVTHLFAPDGADRDDMGTSVAVYGDYAVVGSFLDDDLGTDSGSAYIFKRSSTSPANWDFFKKLTAFDGDSFDTYGEEVDIFGDIIVVGARYDEPNGTRSGSVYIYGRNVGGIDNWGHIKKLAPNDIIAQERFGDRVTLYDDVLVVGLPSDDDIAENAGSAYIFERNLGGNDNWGLLKKVYASDGQMYDSFGSGVSLHAEYLAVSATGADIDTTDEGAAYMFYKDQGGLNNWGQVQKVVAEDGASGDRIGFELSIYDTTLIMGAPSEEDPGFNSTGSVYVFNKNQGGIDNWGQSQKLAPTDLENFDRLGYSVSIYEDILIAGAVSADFPNVTNSGAGYLFQFDSVSNTWALIQKLFASDVQFSGFVGQSSDIYEEYIVISGEFSDAGGLNRGSAYMYEPEDLSCMVQSDSVYLAANGKVTLDTTDLSISNFGGHDTVYISKSLFDCNDISASPALDSLIGITGSDTTVCTFEVAVLDTISPTATCEDIITYLDSFGLVTVSPIDIPATTDDNCVANLIRVFPDDYDCTHIGINPATFQTIDPSGNTGDCPFMITVLDSFPPFTDCKDLTIYLDANGMYSLSTDNLDSIVHLTYDNCSIDSIGINKDDYSCADMPSTIATMTFKDQSGNISTCDVIITVLDTISPVLSCTDLTRDLQSNQMVDIVSNDAILTIDDNCGIDTTFLSQYTFGCNDIVPPFQQDTLEFVSFFNVFPIGDGGGVDADDNRIFVPDPDNTRVKVFDYDGNIIHDFNTGHQSNDVAVDEDGNIYVISYILNRVQIYNSLGQSQFFFNDQVNQPVGVEVYNNKLYVANQGSGHVNRYDLNGNFETTVAFQGSNLQSLRISQDKIITCKNTSCKVLGLNGDQLYNLTFTDLTHAGVFDEDDNLYMPQYNIGKLSVHNGDDGSERFSLDLPVKSVAILDDKLFTLDQDVNIYNLLLTEGEPPALPSAILTAQDSSGNSTTCTIDVTITDTHGYCCPDSLLVNYNPIDSTDYFASDSICSNGQVATATAVNFRSSVIKLDTTFQVDGGGVFQVLNEDCNN